MRGDKRFVAFEKLPVVQSISIFTIRHSGVTCSIGVPCSSTRAVIRRPARGWGACSVRRHCGLERRLRYSGVI